eukprot:345021-Amphidinium_carterae.1
MSQYQVRKVHPGEYLDRMVGGHREPSSPATHQHSDTPAQGITEVTKPRSGCLQVGCAIAQSDHKE